MKAVKLKSPKTEMQNSLEGLNSKFDLAKFDLWEMFVENIYRQMF